MKPEVVSKEIPQASQPAQASHLAPESLRTSTSRSAVVKTESNEKIEIVPNDLINRKYFDLDLVRNLAHVVT